MMTIKEAFNGPHNFRDKKGLEQWKGIVGLRSFGVALVSINEITGENGSPLMGLAIRTVDNEFPHDGFLIVREGLDGLRREINLVSVNICVA